METIFEKNLIFIENLYKKLYKKYKNINPAKDYIKEDGVDIPLLSDYQQVDKIILSTCGKEDKIIGLVIKISFIVSPNNWTKYNKLIYAHLASEIDSKLIYELTEKFYKNEIEIEEIYKILQGKTST